LASAGSSGSWPLFLKSLGGVNHEIGQPIEHPLNCKRGNGAFCAAQKY
jgi:hypothetical protein